MTETEIKACVAESRARLHALKAVLAEQADATETEKCDLYRAHGFATRNTL